VENLQGKKKWKKRCLLGKESFVKKIYKDFFLFIKIFTKIFFFEKFTKVFFYLQGRWFFGDLE